MRDICFLNILITILLLASSNSITAQSIQKLNIIAGVESGAIQVNSSAIDIGSINNIFTGDNELARSANINPFIVTLQFSNNISIVASRILMTYSTGNWHIACANTLYDLENETGSYFIPFATRVIQNGVADSIGFSTYNCKFVRLTAQRTSGDNYVHLNSWNLYVEQSINTLEIRTPQNDNQAYREKDFPLTVFGSDSNNGLLSELPNDEIIWSTSNNSIATISNGILKGHSVGMVTITAQYNSIVQNKQIKIIEDNNAPDLCISYIKQLPEIEYVTNSSNPTVEGWPAIGQEISWKAYVRNYSPTIQTNVSYRWLLNGEQIATGTIDEIKPYALAHASLNAIWSFDRDELTFEIDINNTVDEVLETNNSLMVYTNALTVGFYVEQYVYDYFHQYQYELNAGRNSWDDWAQFHIKYWNEMMANAIFPMSPNGVLDRIRIDSIAVVPDGALPLHGGLASNNPNNLDKTVDLQWGFPTSLIVEGSNFYSDHTTATTSNPFYYESSLFHELGHARYLHDNYLYDVHYGNNEGQQYIRIRENGTFIANTEYMPVLAYKMVHDSYYKGLMSDDYTVFDEYCAVLYNLKAGERALCGNMNAPCDINSRINDLPEKNYIKLHDQFGNELQNGRISIYQVSYDLSIDKWVFEDNAAFYLDANEAGIVDVGRCPFTQDGYINTYYNGCSELYCIMRVEHHNRVGYQFVESSAFNMEYWKGNTDSAWYELQIPMVYNETAQTIELIEGWNLISFSLFVNNKDISSLFAPIWQQLEAIKTNESFYISENPTFLNSLNKVEDGKAYLVKVSAPVNLTFSGTVFDTSQITYSTKAGWQMIGSIYETSRTIEAVLNENNIQPLLIKNFQGFWIPQGTTNSLSNFVPNTGYFMKIEN